MLEGKVKWFDDKKGYGFIASEGKDYFVHYREIKSVGFKTLVEGSNVSFNPGMGDKGALARDVEVI
jgi:CspA family cold shock protein